MREQNTYIIAGGVSGSDRLNILANATWDTSLAFLQNAGLNSSMNMLDLGCGNGEIALRIIKQFGIKNLIGIDSDTQSISLAEHKFQAKQVRWQFNVMNLESDQPFPKSDFIYMRFLLAHLKQPQSLLERAKEALHPNGIIAIEDIDFDGHFSYPKSNAFDTYVALFKQAAIRRGADPLIGAKIPDMLRKAGFPNTNIKMNVILPTFSEGDGKQMAILTLKSIRKAVIDLKLISELDFNNVENDLRQLTQDPHSIMSLPRIFQVWVR